MIENRFFFIFFDQARNKLKDIKTLQYKNLDRYNQLSKYLNSKSSQKKAAPIKM